MRFEKFYKVDLAAKGGIPAPAYLAVTTDGVVFGLTNTQMTMVGPVNKVPIPAEAKELSVDDWKTLGFPIGLMFDEPKEPRPAKPLPRELTEDEQQMDHDYEAHCRDWLARGMERAAEVLAKGRCDPFYVNTWTNTRIEKQEYAFPLLIDALAAVLGIGPGPVDPIGWRRRKPSNGRMMDVVSSLMEAVGPRISAWMEQKAQAATAQAATDAPQTAEEVPTPPKPPQKEKN